MSEASDDRQCRHSDFGSRDVTVRIHGGDVNVTHVECGKPVWLDHEFLMSEKMPMTLTYSVDEGSDEAYQVLKLRRPDEQPQDDGDVRAPRCPECGATPPNWRPDDVECEICAADLEDTIDDLAEKVEQKQADPDIRYLTQATKMIAAHVRELAAENARLRAALEARDAKGGGEQ